MGVGHWLLRFEDHIVRGLRSDVAQVAHHSDPVHLCHDFSAEVAQATVAGLVAAAADEVLGIVGHLRNADAKLPEELDVPDLVLEGASVLKSEYDPGFARLLRCADLRSAMDRHQDVGVVTEHALPVQNVVHRGLKPFPYRTGAVGSGDSAKAHVLENRSAPS
jgi:hypothetical protein